MSQSNIVTIEQGTLKGRQSKNYRGNVYHLFLGIPYAKSPVGDLRFKAPQDPEPWEGIKDCTLNGKECPSLHVVLNTKIGSERECLNLNVFTKELPNENNTKLKPVMFFVHGGAFVTGSNKTDIYGPDFFMMEDVVLVVPNYRLGVLGFLSFEDPSIGVPGNAGMKDLVQALKWVRQNIKHFGGDPGNVTIFGESAGGASVHYLVLSPLAKDLFHKAIIQSGCSLNYWARGTHNGKLIGKLMEYEETDEKEIFEKLKNEPSKKLLIAQEKHVDKLCPDSVYPFAPVVEKPSEEPAFLLEKPIDLIMSGKFNKVPIIIGYTSLEGMLFDLVRRKHKDMQVTQNFECEIPYDLNLEKGSQQSREVAAKIKNMYYGDEEPSENNIEKFYLLKTDNIFVQEIHRVINHMVKHSDDPIYVYVMTLDDTLNFCKHISLVKSIGWLFFWYSFLVGQRKSSSLRSFFFKMANSLPRKSIHGTAHGDDLGYLFSSSIGPKMVPGSKEDVYVSRFIKMWTNFAWYGNPTPADHNDETVLRDTEWKNWTANEHNYLEIGTELENKLNPNEERIAFWHHIYSRFVKI